MNESQPKKSGVLFLLLVLSSLPFAGKLEAGAPVYVGAKQSSSVALEQIDHEPWNALLAKYVDQNGMVDYRSWKANAPDQEQLVGYLGALSSANAAAKAPKSVKLAFWINAYNAVTIHGILREYPTTSIRNHTAKVFGYNIWHDLQLYVAGKPYSLDTIEHKILRKMSEPRIHFAIVCASIGCPRLLNQAYDAKQVDSQLEMNAKDFFARQQNFKFDTAAKRFQFSAILNWFGEDFGADQRTRLSTIAKWLPSDAARDAANRNSVSVSYLDYNWQLNSQ